MRIPRNWIRAVAALGALAMPDQRVDAQPSAGIPSVDSAAIARGAWGRATRAHAAGTPALALAEARHAARAWPVQPAYAWGWAIIAAAAGDTGAVRDALARYAALGVGRDLLHDARFARFASSPWFDRLARQHTNAGQPWPTSRILATLPDSGFWPEGLAADARTARLYVTSLGRATIAELDDDGTVRRHLPVGDSRWGGMMAVRVDTARGSLVATTRGTAMAGPAVLRIDLASGRVVQHRALASPAGRSVPGDLVILPDGQIVISDSGEPALLVVAPGLDRVRTIRHPHLVSPQGIAMHPDGATLYLADWSLGVLRVRLPSFSISRLRDAPRSTSVGIDGLAWHAGGLIGVQNGVVPARVVRLALDARAAAITAVRVIDRNAAIADEPTNGAVVGGEFVYVANSQWDKRAADGTPLPGVILRPAVLLAVPLPPR